MEVTGRSNGGDSGPLDDDDGPPTTHNAGGHNGQNDREFQLVNARNINITPFSGRNLITDPYLSFNTALRRLIFVQGKDGE